MRGTIEAPVTATYASDTKSVVLTSETPFAAGEYTITIGSLDPVKVSVERQTATSLKIANTTVANKRTARVYFSVLDQYGEPMDSYTDRKLTVKAYNTTKGHEILQNGISNDSYFILDCATQDVSSGAQDDPARYINAIGDSVNVVAYLTDNAGISVTTTLEIASVYMEELEFDDPDLNGDKRVTVGKTYRLPYTAKTNEGEDATFVETQIIAGPAMTRTFEDYTFVTNNVSSVDLADFYVDKDGQMYFTATNVPGTAVITMINNMTGSTSFFTIVVNDLSKMSSLEVADTSIGWDTNATVDGTGDPIVIRAAVTAYDQFGDVVNPKDIYNTDLSTDNPYFQTPTVIPSADITGVSAAKISDDGAYLEYSVRPDFKDYQYSARYKLKGQNLTFNFISKTAGANGYITSSSKVLISDTIEPAALTVVTDPATAVVSGDTIKVKFSVYDQYQNKVALTESASGGAWVYTTNYINVKTPILTYQVVVDDNSKLFSSVTCGSSDPNNKEYELQLKTQMGSNIAATDLARSGQFLLSLKQGGTDQLDKRIAFKNYNLSIIRPVEDYVVRTDKGNYSAGETINVTVDAYSRCGESLGTRFNKYYNATVSVGVTVKDNNDNTAETYSKTLTFKDGTAAFELEAGKEIKDPNYYTICIVDKNNKTKDEVPVFVSNGNQSPIVKYTVGTSAASKLTVNGDGKLQITDAKGNATSIGASTTAIATFKLMDENANKDITSNVKFIVTPTALSVNNDYTVDVVISKENIVATIDGHDYSFADGTFQISNIPAASKNSRLVLYITINGMTYEQRFTATGDGTAISGTFVDPDAKTLNVLKANAEADFAKVVSTAGFSTPATGSGVSVAAVTKSAVGTSGSVITIKSCQVLAATVSGTAITDSAIIGSAVKAISKDDIVGFEISATCSGQAIGVSDDAITVRVTFVTTSTDSGSGLQVEIENTMDIVLTSNGTSWSITSITAKNEE